jgi:hypothetical protein
MCFWIGMRFWFLCLLLVSSALLGAESRIAEITQPRAPRWASPPSEVDLKASGGGCVPLVFSPDSKFLCAWWLPDPPVGDCDKLPGRAVVFDLRGRPVPGATDTDGELTGVFASMFPEIAWRRRFAHFVQNTNNWRISAWVFSADYSAGARFVQPAHQDFARGKVEFWHLGQTNQLKWSSQLQESVNSWTRGTVWLDEINGRKIVLVAFCGMNAYVLSQEEGKQIASFTYGKRESEAEAEARRRKFGLHGDAYEAGTYFFAGPLAYDPSQKILACGDANSRRLRVVAVEKPQRMLYEMNAGDNPARPRGGSWRVSSVHFDAKGKYLVVGYDFGGRLTSKEYEPIEVYDTLNWQLVWSVNSPDICSAQPPRISPDGKMLALTRHELLQIGQFVPQSRTGEKSSNRSGK